MPWQVVRLSVRLYDVEVLWSYSDSVRYSNIMTSIVRLGCLISAAPHNIILSIYSKRNIRTFQVE